MPHSQTSNKMKTFCLTLALCACLAAADVSHLQPGSSYLPPPRPEHAVSMSIEPQELRELPEQVEYMRLNEQGQMEAMPSSLLTPPAPADQEEAAQPSTRYLPPAPAPAPVPLPVQMDAEPMMMAQMETMAPEEAVMEKLQEQPEPANRYLPPAPVSEEQLTYQQYQEQMHQFQMQEQQQQQQEVQPQEQQPQQFQDQPAEEEQQMPYVLDAQQPLAPSDVETQEQLEPEPAHELRADGYHYKQAEEQRRLRH